MAAKTKELEALQAAIESTLEKIGNLGTASIQLQNDLAAAVEALDQDRKFLAELEKGCATKTSDFECSKKTRSAELVALTDTIKVLNDDDALDLFKKTLPSASSSLMQVKVTSGRLQARAAIAIAAARRAGAADLKDRVQLDLITLALHGKKIGFEKVTKMIDAMIETLKKEQTDDDDKKEYCVAQFDSADGKKKALERSVSDLGTAIESIEVSIGELKGEIAALRAGIKALDKAVAEATEQRKEENEEFKALMASDTAPLSP